MRILLLVPPLSGKTRLQTGHGRFIPHLGLAYIGAVLKEHGHGVFACDAAAERLTLEDTGRIIREIGPDIVGVTSFTSQIYEAHEVAAIAKRINRSILTVIGGNHASALPEETLREFGSFDAAIAGEGEDSMAELAGLFSRERTVDGRVRGIAYRTKQEVRLAPPRPPIDDLDSIPFPDFSIFRLDRYRAFYSLFGAKRTLPLLASRGCSYKCRFCFRLFGNEVRFRTVDNVIEEIRRDGVLFRAGQIFFQDETFTIDRERTAVFCEKLLQAGIHKRLTWVCETRVDAVDRQLLALMRRAGCTLVSYGIESGNREILEKIRKDITLEQAETAVKMTKESGIRVYTNFMLGHPYETHETVAETLDFVRKLDPDYASFSILSPFPGTEVKEMAEQGTGGLKLLSRDWRDYGTQFGNALELERLSRGELENYQKRAYLRQYLRWGRLSSLVRIVDLSSIPGHLYQFFLKHKVELR